MQLDNKMILRIIMLCIVLCSPTIKAETSLVFGGISHHFISEKPTNNFHRVFLIDHNDFLFGYVRNSYDQDSFVVTYNIFKENSQNYEFDVYLGAVRGYDRCYGTFQENENNKSKVIACGLVVFNVTIKTETYVKPMFSLWGDALVFTGKIDF
jgi:hypothetical protein